ncbi:MAG: DNA polymerase IV [Spirochaetes bacterium]|nr:DNA polymerase IV [Spirochaetota bacterium]
MIKKIIHVDMDAFYASIEQRDNVKLKSKPIIVGGSPDARGVVCAASYEARKYGIRSAMPTKLAIQKYPDLIVVKPNFRKYEEVSEQLISIYKMFTDKIEPLSLDECFLDVTKNRLGIATAVEIGKSIKSMIKMELHLTASIGIAPNKLLAKIASDYKKPDGFLVIKPHQVDSFIKNLEVDKLWGVGKVTFEKMIKMNIKTCLDLQKFSMIELIDQFGSYGETLYYFARGIDEREVISERIEKSIGAERTFTADTDDLEVLNEALKSYTKIVVDRLVSENIKAKTITLKLKYEDFSHITRSKTMGYYINDFEEIYNIASNLLKENYDGMLKIRLIGISVSNLNTQNKGQLNLNL